jgi:hypothetical protein
MSAYQVNQDTVDLIVSVLVSWNKRGGSPTVYTYGEPPTDEQLITETETGRGYMMTRADYTTADAIGRELIDANVKSLATRYSDGVEMCSYYSESYTWKPVLDSQVLVARAMGAVNCYRYQACEHDGWRGSFADELSARVMDKLVDLISEGWDYERPANEPQIVSIMDLVRKNKGGK